MSRPVCVVTGGTSGVGLSTALLFAKQGFDIVTCGRDPERIAGSRDSIEALGGHCLVLEFDLDSNASSAGEIVDRAMEKFGRVDLLVNNAAVAPLSEFASQDSGEFETALNVNQRSVFYLTQVAWRQMLTSGSGCIINISSLAAIDPFPGFSVYGSSKAWIDLFTLALASEGKEAGVRVYSIRPGAVETPLLRSLFPEFPADQAVSPDLVAKKVWELWQDSDGRYSGQAFTVSNQNDH